MLPFTIFSVGKELGYFFLDFDLGLVFFRHQNIYKVVLSHRRLS